MTANTKKRAVHQELAGGLIVSCQPVENGPMDTVQIVTALAEAAVEGGGHGLRIEGVEKVAAVVDKVKVPVVGIVKRDLADSSVRITPYLSDVDALAKAGASIIAFDGTDRCRPTAIEAIIKQIHSHGCLAMADVSTLKEGVFAHQLGCDYIGSTLSGYTSETTPKDPDFELVEQLAKAGCCVIAEGRYNSPELAAQAIKLGATAVTVGSAITRVEHISGWFAEAIELANTAKQETA